MLLPIGPLLDHIPFPDTQTLWRTDGNDDLILEQYSRAVAVVREHGWVLAPDDIEQIGTLDPYHAMFVHQDYGGGMTELGIYVATDPRKGFYVAADYEDTHEAFLYQWLD
jgi:hypothetical protein